jgi:hypothetical protein
MDHELLCSNAAPQTAIVRASIRPFVRPSVRSIADNCEIARPSERVGIREWRSGGFGVASAVSASGGGGCGGGWPGGRGLARAAGFPIQLARSVSRAVTGAEGQRAS